MGYKIEYGISKQDNLAQRSKPILFIAGILLLGLIITVLIAFPDEVSEIRRIVFPALEPEVIQAFQTMLDRIGEGTDFSDAAAAFCKEIIVESTH